LSSILSAQKVDIYKRPLNFERSHDYDAVHYKLEFKFDMEKKIYWGENQVTLLPLKDDFQQCVLDAEDFTVTSVAALNGEPLKFEQTDHSLIIDLSKKYDYKQRVSFVIKYYENNSKKGLRFIEAAADYPAQINTFAWPEGARHWFPCFDFPNDKVTNELIATVKNDFKVLSNGKLVKVTEDKENNTKTYHWSQELPHSTYLIMMAAGPFEVIEDSLGSLPVNYWVYKKDVHDAMRSFRKTPEMIDFYNKTFGFNYPWAKYDQVCIAGSGGGMEDTSATTLGHGTIHDERAEQDFSSDGLVAHELAHQWWGDTITERTWSHVWLSESFATYSEYLYSRHDRGEDEGAVNLLGKKNSYLREAHNKYIRPIVFNRYNNPWNIMDSHSYPKGATILHMLRFVMGDKPFFRSLQHFLEKHSFQAVDTHDLMKAVKESSGQNLDWFFEQWIFKPGHPVFDINYQWNESTRKLKLRIIQTQDTSITKAPNSKI
jgi:aminopeptidase N